MVYHNCHKSYIYYVEFIGQIGEDNHSFLQLNSKDATLFVYKKTIFEISNDTRKNYSSTEAENVLINNVESLIKTYNILLFNSIDHNDLINVIKYTNTDLQNTMQKIIKIYIDTNNPDFSHKINAILTFVMYFKKDNILDFLDSFIKKIKKKDSIDLLKLERVLLDENGDSNISPIKYINSLVAQL